MTRSRAALPWLCAALIACATGPRPRASDGDGDGIPDDVDLCPDRAEDIDGVDDRDGCPEFPAGYDGNAPKNEPPLDVVADADGDGIPDPVDECPREAEDRDGFDDTDGCPDPDNDHDRILDVNDKCPNDPEAYNGVSDDDGCPDTGPAIWGGPAVRFVTVPFARNRSVLEREPLAIVASVAAALEQYCLVVEVQGHTSVRESDVTRLGSARAEAVKAALVARGISAQRMSVRSYGATRPVCSDHTEACRKRNRRVEFVVDWGASSDASRAGCLP